jgi:hypothetical protein
VRLRACGLEIREGGKHNRTYAGALRWLSRYGTLVQVLDKKGFRENTESTSGQTHTPTEEIPCCWPRGKTGKLIVR